MTCYSSGYEKKLGTELQAKIAASETDTLIDLKKDEPVATGENIPNQSARARRRSHRKQRQFKLKKAYVNIEKQKLEKK